MKYEIGTQTLVNNFVLIYTGTSELALVRMYVLYLLSHWTVKINFHQQIIF